jgi:hypothetical protein
MPRNGNNDQPVFNDFKIPGNAAGDFYFKQAQNPAFSFSLWAFSLKKRLAAFLYISDTT